MHHTVLFLLLVITIVFPSSALAEEPPLILIVETMPVAVIQETSQAIVGHLEDLGFRQGETADIRVLYAEGNRELARERILTETSQRTPDLVITLATLASQAAHDIFKGTDVPVLFGIVRDPVGAGIIEEVNKPSGMNITGRVLFQFPEVKLDFAKRLLGDTLSRPLRIGVVQTDYPSELGDMDALTLAADPDVFTFVTRQMVYLDMPKGKDAMYEQARSLVRELEDQVDFWWILSGPLGECADFTDVFLQESDHPILLGHTVDHVEAGALFCVGGDHQAWGRELAEMATDILKGADPGTMTVQPFATFLVGLNLDSILDQGLIVPPDMLKLAEGNIHPQ